VLSALRAFQSRSIEAISEIEFWIGKEIHMKTQLSRICAIAAVGLFAVCASPRPASAQSVQGSFTLSHEIRWQNANLPAGDYTFSMESVARPIKMILRGPSGSVFELSSATSERKTDEPSSLTLERRGGTSFVRELYLADLGLHIRYGVPKIPKNEKELAQGPASTEQVLVAMAK
jgi:hypothetical protein